MDTPTGRIHHFVQLVAVSDVEWKTANDWSVTELLSIMEALDRYTLRSTKYFEIAEWGINFYRDFLISKIILFLPYQILIIVILISGTFLLPIRLEVKLFSIWNQNSLTELEKRC